MLRVEILVRQGADEIVDDTTDTRYQLASVSKQFTAAAALLLVEEGRLSLDDPVTRWIGGCPDEWREVTLHHLLTHTSGIGHWDEFPMLDVAQRVTPEELLNTFRCVPLQYPPGKRWSYSSPAYVLLAHVIEQAADTSYRDFLEERIFDHLGLSRTFAGAPGARPDVALGHDADGQRLPTFELDVMGMGAGDVWSTAKDVLAWLDALQDDRLLSEQYRTLMLTEHARTGKSLDESGYGYGVFVGELNGRRWWHHSGHNSGYKSFAGNIPELGRRIVVLSNTEATDAGTAEALLP